MDLVTVAVLLVCDYCCGIVVMDSDLIVVKNSDVMTEFVLI